MKGKERSPVKNRSRALDDTRERGGNHPTTKMGALSVTGSNNGTTKSSTSSRRGLLGEKGVLRVSKGRNISSRPSSNYDYGGNELGSNSKVYCSSNSSMDSATARSSSRGETRSPPNNESEYKTLKISELGSQLNDEEIEDGLFHEFKKFGDVSVKISRVNDERVALVNFRRPEDARAAKHARGKLVLYDRPLKIEAVYMNRRRSRSPVQRDAFAAGQIHLHTQRQLSPGGIGNRDYRLQQLALGRLPPPPSPPHLRDLEREREFSLYDARARALFIPESTIFREEEVISPEDDQRANRTLFLGNLDITVTESDLRRSFNRFGMITEVDIKRPVRGQNSTYGFLKFENLDMAHRAKISMTGKVVGRNPIKIGYGKATPTTRLWVGGLGPWVHPAALAREFDRFGTIRTIDYRKGDAWAYIQYESLDAAQAACVNMRGFPLGGPDRRIRVDFAAPYAQPPPVPHYHLGREPFPHHHMSMRERSPPLPVRFRERDLYSVVDWPHLMVNDRAQGAGFESFDHLERRYQDSWPVCAEQELYSRDQGRTKRRLDDAWRLDRSTDSSEYVHRHHGNSLEHSPGGSSRDGGRYSDSERHPCSDRSSPSREHHRNPEHGLGEKRRRTLSPPTPGSSSEKSCKRKSSELPKSPEKRESRTENSSSSGSSLQTKQSEGGPKFSQAWRGDLLLKNSSFPTSMHLLEGDMAMVTGLLVDGAGGGQVSQLKINQRLRLDQPKLDEVSRRIKAAGPSGYSILISVPGKSESELQDAGCSTERPLKNLVSYLKQKEAAGVISLPVGGSRDKERTGILHAFPPCDFSQQFLDVSAKAYAKSEEDYLVIIIVRGSS